MGHVEARNRVRLLSVAPLASIVLLAAAVDARAQSSAPPQGDAPAATPAAPASAEDDSMWHHDYDVARERLLAGAFDEAADRFDALLPRAPDAQQRVLTETLRDLARSYGSRGLALVRRNDLGESALPARAVNERTTDEIALLYLNTLTYGVGTGLWVAAHTQPDSAAGAVLPMLAATGAFAGTVAALDIGHPLRYGVPQSAVAGLYLGLEEGLVLSLWNQSQSDTTAHWSGTTVADVIWTMSTVGMVGGGVLGSTLGATPGRASFVGSAGLWTGSIIGLAAAAAASDDATRASTALLAAGIGLNAGIVAGVLLARPVSPSIGRVRFLDVGGLAGVLLFGGLYLAAADKHIDGSAASGVTALGAATGLGVAWWATRNMPADRPEDRAHLDAFHWEPSLEPVPGGAALGIAGTM